MAPGVARDGCPDTQSRASVGGQLRLLRER
jgi:hypothetical protein